MPKGLFRLLQGLFIFLDLLVLNGGYIIAQEIFPENIQSNYFLRYQQYLVFINVFWILISWIDKVYSTKYISYFNKFLKKTLRTFVICLLLMIVYLYLPRRIELSSMLVYTTICLFFIGLIINRFIYLGIKYWVKQQIDLKRKVLIIGHNSLATKLATYLEKDALGISIVGFIDDSAKEKEYLNVPVFKDISDTLKIAKRLRVNEIYTTVMPESNSYLYNIMKEADKELIRFWVVPDFSYLIDMPIFIDYLRDLPVFSIRREPLQSIINRIIKRTFDIIVSAFVTVFILSWLVPLLGLIIKLESRGPILFIQLRSGLNNQPFRCFKFRSMGANNESEHTQVTKNDMRVTRVGRILRKTSLDEFPQFLNVLKGEMSIVGPRPHMLKHTKSFSNLADDYMIRQFLKPGITGWAQVSGFRGEITELYHIKKRVEHDLWYLENWKLSLDIKIMFLTVYNVFKGEEAAY